MYKYRELKTIHLEMTERCNAACLQCSRNINGGEQNPHIKNRELALSDIQKFIPKKLCKQLSHIYMCGNYGDPIVAKDTLDAFKYFREQNSNLLLSMNTNASARSAKWWSDLAKIYGDNGYVIFSIDGLKDTNHVYRKNTVWEKIIENAEAFINAGGKAYWEYIVFEHNEHQVEEARKLSKSLGFQKFVVKKSARFATLNGDIKEKLTVEDKKGNLISISPPKNKLYRNEGLKNSNSSNHIAIEAPRTYDEIKDKVNPEIFFDTPRQKEFDTAEINCKVQKEKSIYISAEGVLQPCCWVANQMYPWHHRFKSTQVWKLINKVGKDKIDLHNYSLEQILDSGYFDSIVNSWDKSSCKEGKLQICSKTCGKNLETFSKQYF